MATFGNTSTTHDDYWTDQDWKVATRYTLSEPGTVSKLTAYVKKVSGAGRARLFIQATDGANGDPGTLLGVAQEMVISNTELEWIDAEFDSPIQLAAGDYWLGLQFGGGVHLVGLIGGDGRCCVNYYSQGLAETWSGAWNENVQWCIYGTYASEGPALSQVFGQTTVSATSGSDLRSLLGLGKYTLNEAGDVSKLSFYLNNQASGHKACNLKGIIYAADGAGGNPGTRMAVTPAVAIEADKEAGWVDLEFTSPIALPPDDYWIGTIFDSNAAGITVYNGGTTGGSMYVVVGSYASPEATCPSPPMLTSTEKLCGYATYTASESLAPTLTSISPERGYTTGGTSVTLTGEGFTGATGVTFGGTAATNVTVVNDTTITCTTPAKTSGSSKVVVVGAEGNSTDDVFFEFAGEPTYNMHLHNLLMMGD